LEKEPGGKLLVRIEHSVDGPQVWKDLCDASLPQWVFERGKTSRGVTRENSGEGRKRAISGKIKSLNIMRELKTGSCNQQMWKKMGWETKLNVPARWGKRHSGMVSNLS